MDFKVVRTVSLGNGYSLEFVITDPFNINYHVVTEQDPTLVANSKVCIGSDSCIRAGEEEPLRDFAARAREHGLVFAGEMIVEHKQSLDLSAILGEVLEPDTALAFSEVLDEVVCKETTE